MNKSKFIIGDEYIHQIEADSCIFTIYTYVGKGLDQVIGIFTDFEGTPYHFEYTNMIPCTKVEPKYPNPPLPHCEERIAFAKGANIEYLLLNEGIWHNSATPSWNPKLKYRVKTEKTKDDLRIEKLEQLIKRDMRFLDTHRKQLAELKPKIHY
jgi:hypothetical protein